MYEYRAKVIDVIDGDTIKVDIDLGFNIYFYGQRLRLARINTPEIKTHEGKVSKNIVTQLLLNKNITIQTVKRENKDKYGRYEVDIIVDGYNLNNWLVENNYAVKYE